MIKIISSKSRIPLSILVLLMITACGSGGGSDSGTPVVDDTPVNDQPVDDSTNPDVVVDEPDPIVVEPTTEELCAQREVDGRLTHTESESLVQWDEDCGQLSYGFYANQGETEKLSLIPDFSYAGFMGGGVTLPEVAVVQTLAPQAGDNRERIQTAINGIAALTPNDSGFRGALLLEAGTWEVEGTLTISASGIVLRGEGQGTGGTTLVATQATQHDFIRIEGSGSGLGEVADSAVAITSAVVPVGTKSFMVEDAAGFSVGDTVGIKRTPNDAWITALDMAQWGWEADAYDISHERTITAIDGNTVTVDIPLVDTISVEYGGGELFLANISSRIEKVGVEHIRLESEFASDEDEEHGWNAVVLSRTENSWVKSVTSVYFGYSAVSITNESNFNTVQDVAQLDPKSLVEGGRRYSFYVADGIGNLFNRCYARDGRHNFVTGSRVTGPNVWLDCLSEQNNSDEGPHHRWATGILFDNLNSASFRVQNRQDSGSGHGWAGAQTLFWNVEAGADLIVDAPLGAMNWSMGSSGEFIEGLWAPDEPQGIVQSNGTPVSPRSLYLAQLEDRLGVDAVTAVTIEAQQNGTIWDLIRGWSGEGALEDATPSQGLVCNGILNGSVCCAESCGSCGGSGCGSRPGGASACCTGTILEDNLSCAVQEAPCVMF